MKYKLKRGEGSIEVVVSDLKGREEDVIEAFSACRDGRCSCPTEEYRKLKSLDITRTEDTIRLQLKAHAGKDFDVAEIGRCLANTKRAIDSGDG